MDIFAVTQSRTQLCAQKDFDKDEDENVIWNKYMIKKVINQAYIGMLNTIVKNPGKFIVTAKDIYAYFPKGIKKKLANGTSNIMFDLEKTFYKSLVASTDALLPTVAENQWINVSSARFVSLFVDNEDIETKIIEFTRYFYENNDNRKRVVKCPKIILQALEHECIEKKQGHKQSNKIEEAKITESKFYKEIFLPNIDLFREAFDNTYIDILLEFAVLNMPQDLELNKYKCIPTTNGEFKKANDLVNPESEISILFKHDPSYYPRWLMLEQKENKREISYQLRLLGMKTYLPQVKPEEILESAKTISMLESRKDGKERCEQILKYIEDCDRPSNVLSQLNNIAFLPILQPLELQGRWELPWGGSGTLQYISPSQSFSKMNKSVIACCGIISEIDCSPSKLIHHKKVEWTDICQQLHALKAFVNSSSDFTENSTTLANFNDCINGVYSWLNKQFYNNSETDFAEQLKNMEFVAVQSDKKEMIFVSADVCADECIGCAPYLYGLPFYDIITPFRSKYECLHKAMGLKERFEVSDFIDLLHMIANNSDTVDESCHDFSVIKQAITAIENECKKAHSLKPETKDIFLPDTRGKMTSANRLYYETSDWKTTNEDIQIMHNAIPISFAKLVGIKALQECMFDELSSEIPFSEEFGQHEELTTRIRGILEGYDMSSDILKELIQNADDAGATELEFVLDVSNHSRDKVFSDSWKELQGPALLVYNNKSFSEEDMIGIQKLGSGSKEDNPLATGKYGVGFNSVYHLTDVPSFLTTNAEGKQTLCVLDPHCTYITRSNRSKPGRKIVDVPQLREIYPDVLKSFELTEIKEGEFTIFRFPLRTENMAKWSKLSRKVVTTEIILDMFTDIANNASEMMFFLRNMATISIAKKQDTDCKIIHTASVVLDEKNAKIKSQFHKSEEHYINKQSFEVAKYFVHIKSGNMTTKWLVVQQLGLKTVPKLYNTEKLLPKGGIAVLTDENNLPIHKKDSKVYALLPLPIETGLPMHINGQFYLEYENRRNLWQGSSNDSYYKWNMQIIDIIANCYLEIMQYFTANLPLLNVPYEHVQKIMCYLLKLDLANDTSVYMQQLVKTIYIEINQQDIKLFPVIYRKNPEKDYLRVHQDGDNVDIIWKSYGEEELYFDDLDRIIISSEEKTDY